MKGIESGVLCPLLLFQDQYFTGFVYYEKWPNGESWKAKMKEDERRKRTGMKQAECMGRNR